MMFSGWFTKGSGTMLSFIYGSEMGLLSTTREFPLTASSALTYYMGILAEVVCYAKEIESITIGF